MVQWNSIWYLLVSKYMPEKISYLMYLFVMLSHLSVLFEVLLPQWFGSNMLLINFLTWASKQSFQVLISFFLISIRHQSMDWHHECKVVLFDESWYLDLWALIPVCGNCFMLLKNMFVFLFSLLISFLYIPSWMFSQTKKFFLWFKLLECDASETRK